LVDNAFYEDILPKHRHVTLFSQVQQIIAKFDCDVIPTKAEFSTYLRQALSNVTSVISLIENDDDFEYTNCVKLIQDQLVQLTSKQRKYTMNTYLNAFTIFHQSSKTQKSMKNICKKYNKRKNDSADGEVAKKRLRIL